MQELTLSILEEKLAICRLDASVPIPLWARENNFFSITKTRDELSIVCLEEKVPQDIKVEKGWRAFKVEGLLDFALTGILAGIAKPLAESEISIFAISTYNTDYILVKEENLEKAIKVLSKFYRIKRP